MFLLVQSPEEKTKRCRLVFVFVLAGGGEGLISSSQSRQVSSFALVPTAFMTGGETARLPLVG